MLLIKQAELHAYLEKKQHADVRCRYGRITEIAANLEPKSGETVIDARGAALLPGLHDHHIHLLALAAEQFSVHCGPPRVRTVEELQAALHQSISGRWIRGIQYHESIAGELDRWQLDKLISDRPLRVQHRSGILWMLNSCAIEQLQLEREIIDGLERNAQGILTGRLFRLDSWLRKKIASLDKPDLSSISLQLARYGITGITDTSADNDADSLALFESATRRGEFHQHLILMGNEQLPPSAHPRIHRGALKILLDEFQLPAWEELCARIPSAHREQRPVAFHCVTEAQLVFALSVLQEAGTMPGDRIEHASICPDAVIPMLKNSGIAIVTQPGLLQSRGTQYQQEVEPSQHPLLYRCKSFLHHGIPLALSSDAPYGEVNPWKIMQVSIDRSNHDGYIFGEAEKLTPEEALLAYLRHPVNLSQHRTIAPGETADFCLLNRPWDQARKQPASISVSLTTAAGKIIYSA